MQGLPESAQAVKYVVIKLQPFMSYSVTYMQKLEFRGNSVVNAH